MNKNDKHGEVFPITSCPGKIDVPTEKEREALMAMKGIKDRVRVLKKRISDLEGSKDQKSAEEIVEMKRQLSILKEEWEDWEGKRKKAARERMILLGHEEEGE